jgi:hypothetical protein
VISENSIDMNAARRRLGKWGSIQYPSFTEARIKSIGGNLESNEASIDAAHAPAILGTRRSYSDSSSSGELPFGAVSWTLRFDC